MLPFHPPEKIRKPKVLRCFHGDQEGTLEKKVKISNTVENAGNN